MARFSSSSSWFTRASIVVGIAGAIALATGCSAEADEPTDDGASTSAEQGLSGACSGAFASCVAGGGGGACAQKWCTGACVGEVASCVRGGGGAACASRCTGGVGCQPREEWTEIATTECGFVVGNPLRYSTTIYGRARATCTRYCDGTLRNCNVWHYQNGRAQCTLGYPVDAAGNPW